MNGLMSGLLEQMRVKLTAEGQEAFGPDSDEGTDAGGEAGESGAENDEASVDDAFDIYMGDIVLDLMDEYEVDAAGAEDFMFGVLFDMIDAQEIPELPEDDDTASLSVWLGAAKSAGFEARVLEAAAADADAA